MLDPWEVGDLTFSSYWSQDHRVSPNQMRLEMLLGFPKLELLISRSHTGLSFCLEEVQNRGSEIRGAVHWGPKIKAWPSVMSKVLVIEEALDIGQTERMRNQRILYAGHTAAPLRKGGGSTGILCTLWCVYKSTLHCMVQGAQLLLPRVSKLIPG